LTKRNDSNTGVEEPLDTSVEPALEKDAEAIVDAFDNEYVKYYGKYSEASRLERFIDQEMPESFHVEDQIPDELLWSVRSESLDLLGAGALKFDNRTAELGSTIIFPEYRNKTTETEDGDKIGVYEDLFSHRLDKAMNLKENDLVDVVNTQLLADKTAATQHVADKQGFVVTGIYNRKFPVAYQDKGRVTVVDMICSDSRINNKEKVYLPEDLRRPDDQSIIEYMTGRINQERSNSLDPFSRLVSYDQSDHRLENYRIDSKAVDKPEENPMNFAEVSIVRDSDAENTWEDVLDEIGGVQKRVQNGDDDYWVGISLDANGPYSPSAAEELKEFGFEYAGFNPAKLGSKGDRKDSLEMQYNPTEREDVKQFIPCVKQLMDKIGLDYSTEDIPECEKTGYSESEAVRV